MMPIASTRCRVISGRRRSALAGRVIGAMMSGFAALSLETSVDRSLGGSGHGMTSTMSHGGLAALCAAWKDLACTWPNRSLAYINTIRFGATRASLKMSPMNWTARWPNIAPVGKLRYTYCTFCWPSWTDFATLAVIGSAAEMSMRNGIWRCCATGTMAAESPELKAPNRIWAPAFTRRSASGRATSGLDWVSPRTSSSRAPPSALIPPAALISSAAIWAPARHAWPGSARGPVTGWITPTLTVGVCARRTAGNPRAETPATTPAPFTNDRRSIRDLWLTDMSSPPLAQSEQLARDDHPLDLVGAFVDLHDLGVPHEPLHRELPRVPDTPEDLDRVRRDLHGRVRGE